MTEIIKKAIEKIDNESEKLDVNAKKIASHIIDTYLNSDKNAEKVLNEKKTFRKCIENIISKAKQQAVGRMAMIDDETVFGWVQDYYGFAGDCKDDKIIDLLDFI